MSKKVILDQNEGEKRRYESGWTDFKATAKNLFAEAQTIDPDLNITTKDIKSNWSRFESFVNKRIKETYKTFGKVADPLELFDTDVDVWSLSRRLEVLSNHFYSHHLTVDNYGLRFKEKEVKELIIQKTALTSDDVEFNDLVRLYSELSATIKKIRYYKNEDKPVQPIEVLRVLDRDAEFSPKALVKASFISESIRTKLSGNSQTHAPLT